MEKEPQDKRFYTKFVSYSGNTYKVKIIYLQNGELDITISCLESLAIYRNKCCHFTKINIKALESAFNLENPATTFSLTHTDKPSSTLPHENNEILLLTVTVNPPFLQKISDCVELPKVGALSEISVIRENAYKVQEQLKDIKEKNLRKRNVIAIKKELIVMEGAYNMDNDYNQDEAQEFTLIAQIVLPEIGPYLLTLSMFVKAFSGYLYLYDNNTYVEGPFTAFNNMLSFPSGSCFSPFVLNYKIDSPSKEHHHYIYLYDMYDYPGEISNFILTAKKIAQ